MDQYNFEDREDLIRLRIALEQVLKRLSLEVPPAWMERFLRPLRAHELNGKQVALIVPGKFVSDWVRERYLVTMESMLSDELGLPITIELISEPREREAISTVEPPSTALKAVSSSTKFRPVEKYTFDSFVIGQSNRLAFAGAKAVAADPGMKFNPLFIYGQSGLGKTHLLHAMAREILQRDPKFPLVYVSAQQFSEDFVQALQNNRIDQFRKSQRNVGIWLVDDIQLVAGREKTQEEVFHTFNYLHSLGKQIVLTSDRPPRDLYGMDERLRSRFEAGLVADIQLPDTETRGAILLRLAERDNISLDTSVAMFMAEKVHGNIRKLEGAFTKLVVQASLDNMPISTELAMELVERFYSGGMLAKPSFDKIVGCVSTHFDIGTDLILGISRKAPIVLARHVVVFLTREITKDSWKHIGGLFGDRDHTSMMHAYQKISEMMIDDRDFGATIRRLQRDLYPES